MNEKRFATNGYKIYDTFHDGECLLISETEEIVTKMNNLDTKARERGKHLSKLQKENNQLKQKIKELEDDVKHWKLGFFTMIHEYNEMEMVTDD